MSKKIFEEHFRIRNKSKSLYEKLEGLGKLYSIKEKKNTVPESLLIELRGDIYVEHPLEGKKMEKWLSLRKISQENYESAPIDIYVGHNGDLIFHGHHRAAAHRIFGRPKIHAILYKIDEDLDLSGRMTLDEAIIEYPRD